MERGTTQQGFRCRKLTTANMNLEDCPLPLSILGTKKSGMFIAHADLTDYRTLF